MAGATISPRWLFFLAQDDYWYTQAGGRDGVYFGRVADVPYQVARALFGEHLANLRRKPLPTLDLPTMCVAEVCIRHLE